MSLRAPTRHRRAAGVAKMKTMNAHVVPLARSAAPGDSDARFPQSSAGQRGRESPLCRNLDEVQPAVMGRVCPPGATQCARLCRGDDCDRRDRESGGRGDTATGCRCTVLAEESHQRHLCSSTRRIGRSGGAHSIRQMVITGSFLGSLKRLHDLSSSMASSSAVPMTIAPGTSTTSPTGETSSSTCSW